MTKKNNPDDPRIVSMFVVATPCPHGVQSPMSHCRGMRAIYNNTDVDMAIGEAVNDAQKYAGGKFNWFHPDACILVTFRDAKNE